MADNLGWGDDPFRTLRDSTVSIHEWSPPDVVRERIRIERSIVQVLVARARHHDHGQRPAATRWPGIPELGDDDAATNYAWTAANDYRHWLLNKDLEPVSDLGRGQRANRSAGENRVRSTDSRTRARIHDCVRLTAVCAALAGWRAFTTLEGLHHSLDVFDGVTRSNLGQTHGAFRRTESHSLFDDEREAVSNLASELSHSRLSDLLQVAGNYRLSWAVLRKSPGPRADSMLRQRQTTGLTSNDPMIAKLTEKPDGKPSLYERHWRARAQPS